MRVKMRVVNMTNVISFKQNSYTQVIMSEKRFYFINVLNS